MARVSLMHLGVSIWSSLFDAIGDFLRGCFQLEPVFLTEVPQSFEIVMIEDSHGCTLALQYEDLDVSMRSFPW
jgi:hypothetical protein